MEGARVETEVAKKEATGKDVKVKERPETQGTSRRGMGYPCPILLFAELVLEGQCLSSDFSLFGASNSCCIQLENRRY